jgi:hypothetical protein
MKSTGTHLPEAKTARDRKRLLHILDHTVGAELALVVDAPTPSLAIIGEAAGVAAAAHADSREMMASRDGDRRSTAGTIGTILRRRSSQLAEVA